jgi:hypothetical protein
MEAWKQRYEQRAPSTYWYEAPRFDYAALLQVSTSGFVQLLGRFFAF